MTLYCKFLHESEGQEPIVCIENEKMTENHPYANDYRYWEGTFYTVDDPDLVLDDYWFKSGKYDKWIVKPLTGIEIARLKLEGLI